MSEPSTILYLIYRNFGLLSTVSCSQAVRSLRRCATLSSPVGFFLAWPNLRYASASVVPVLFSGFQGLSLPV